MLGALGAFVRSGPAGLALATTSLAALLAAATGFLDPLSLLITVGGALAVTAATFSPARLANTWRYLGKALAAERDGEAVIAGCKRLARAHRLEGAPALERAARLEPDGFLRRAIALGLESSDEEELREVLMAEARNQAAEGEAARQVMVTLGRLFPAFGLIGTLIGLALMMRHLAGADMATIGPGLGIALLTTLYGAVMSNVVVLPLATKLQAYLAREWLYRQMIADGALLVHRKEYPSRIERVLRAYAGTPAAEEPRHVRPVAARAA